MCINTIPHLPNLSWQRKSIPSKKQRSLKISLWITLQETNICSEEEVYFFLNMKKEQHLTFLNRLAGPCRKNSDLCSSPCKLSLKWLPWTESSNWAIPRWTLICIFQYWKLDSVWYGVWPGDLHIQHLTCFKVQMKFFFLIIEFERAAKISLPFLNISSSSKV